MKRCSVFIFFIFINTLLLAQTGSIKVVKPVKPNTDTVVQKHYRHFHILTNAGVNYTFKSNKKIGYQAGLGIAFAPFSNRYGFLVGGEYSFEHQYYQLSAYNKKLQQAETPFAKSQNTMQYIKLPISIVYRMGIGPYTNINWYAGLQPEYLLKTKDENNRLTSDDFNQYNFAGFVTMRIQVAQLPALSIGYSNNFFNGERSCLPCVYTTLLYQRRAGG